MLNRLTLQGNEDLVAQFDVVVADVGAVLAEQIAERFDVGPHLVVEELVGELVDLLGAPAQRRGARLAHRHG